MLEILDFMFSLVKCFELQFIVFNCDIENCKFKCFKYLQKKSEIEIR